jgi:hypothetical protein
VCACVGRSGGGGLDSRGCFGAVPGVADVGDGLPVAEDFLVSRSPGARATMQKFVADVAARPPLMRSWCIGLSGERVAGGEPSS